MQFIHNVDDLGALDGHDIEAQLELDGKVATLLCGCGWTDVVTWGNGLVLQAGWAPTSARAITGGVVEAMTALADAGRDHLIDVVSRRRG